MKAVLADDASRLKINLAVNMQEVEKILVEFAESHGFKVLEVAPK